MSRLSTSILLSPLYMALLLLHFIIFNTMMSTTMGPTVFAKVVHYESLNPDHPNFNQHTSNSSDILIEQITPGGTSSGASLAYHSKETVDLDPFRISLRDHNGVIIRRPRETSQVTVELLADPKYSRFPRKRDWPSESTSIFSVRDGFSTTQYFSVTSPYVIFSGLMFKSPASGVYTFRFNVTEPWNYTRASYNEKRIISVEDAVRINTKTIYSKLFQLAILPNPIPAGMTFLRAPPYFSNLHAVLLRQPVLRLFDAGNNTIPTSSGLVSVTMFDPSNNMDSGEVTGAIVDGTTPIKNGIAVFKHLRIIGGYPGIRYHLNFSYVPDPTESGGAWYVHNVSVIGKVTPSNCNTTDTADIFTYMSPDRGLKGADVNVTIQGAFFSAYRVNMTFCRYGGEGSKIIVPVRFVDECNVICFLEASTWDSSSYSLKERIYLSTDNGKRWAAGPFFAFLLSPADLHPIFDNPSQQLTSIVQLDPFGFTRVGNVSIYLLDEKGEYLHEHDSDIWDVSVMSLVHSNYLQLTGKKTAVMRKGHARFTNLIIQGFPQLGNYTFFFEAIRRLDSASIVKSKKFYLSYSSIDMCERDPEILRVTSVHGCHFHHANGSVSGCSSYRPIRITVLGKYFSVTGAQVFVDRRECQDVEHSASSLATTLFATCEIPKGKSSKVTVVTNAKKVGTSEIALITSNSPVVIDSVRGCGVDVFPSTIDCLSNSSTNITVIGEHFGPSGATIWLQSFYNPRFEFRCREVNHSVTEPETKLFCMLPGAVGDGYQLRVTNTHSTEVTTSYLPAVSFLQKQGILCPANSEGDVCSLRGSCDFNTGECQCLQTSATGYWTGSTCGECVDGYYSTDCQSKCPNCIAARSNCNDGVNGTGLCDCFKGFGGPICEITCPAGAINPCNDHGDCSLRNATCNCYTNSTHGYWTLEDCSACIIGWSGPLCNIPCPLGSGLVCSGAGTCIAGICRCEQDYCNTACDVSGSSCDGCTTGYWGASCVNACPGGAVNPCGGHGFCADGPLGNGLCTCDLGYAGSDCSISCPPNPSNPCYGNGKCSENIGTCTCYEGFALSDCSQECPGGHLSSCSGHGFCHLENVTCTCDFGYAGLNCSIPCPGGTETPCSLQGKCIQESASCLCDASFDTGYWGGESCEICAEDWWSAECNRQCNKVDEKQCAGHGDCDHNLLCTCYGSTISGFWTGVNCTDCQEGYWGLQCIDECPGTSCAPCSFHGNCSQGVDGDGICTCAADLVNGYWDGAFCERCAYGYYGLNCESRCPLGKQGIVCSGRGSCFEGIQGTGVCTCEGNYGGESCEKCAFGYYGIGCAKTCPGPEGQPCHLRGSCNNTEYSRGTCLCDLGFGGTDCSLLCPMAGRGVCNDHGQCIYSVEQGEMVCRNCDANVVDGFWLGTACDQCQPGYYGSDCKLECPGGAATPCYGQGLCAEGIAGTGACTCRFGYAGLACDKECVGGALLPCTGHGQCDANSGLCSCNSDAISGFWTNEACNQCHPDYIGATCKLHCPTASNGGVCNNHGTCYEGVCISCDSGYCGFACESSDAGCAKCAPGTYSSSCQPCPGGQATPCGGHGTCSEGKYGTGKCYCDSGFRGTACEISCPGPIGIPCYGRGSCSDLGVCTCNLGWAAADCDTICQGFDDVTVGALPCSSVGTCNKADGSCTCHYGYGGTGCEIKCPGKTAPCNSRGTCTIYGNCTCSQSDEFGYWGGAPCDRCSEGYFGDTCRRKCIHGGSNPTYTECVCHEFWSGEDCSAPCPGLLEAGIPCHGHGNCSWGRDASATCTCNDTWYDTSCTVYCTKQGCDEALTHGQCNKEKGFCECQFDATGYWAVVPETQQCDTCDINYFGENCEIPCLCNGHGLCNRRTGDCTCYTIAEEGFWGGKFCDICEDGFVGITCKGVNVKVSRLGAAGVSFQVSSLAVSHGVICSDPLNNISYFGTNPLGVIDTNTKAPLGSINLNGFALRCYFKSETELYVLVFMRDENRYVVVQRGTVNTILRTEVSLRLTVADKPLLENPLPMKRRRLAVLDGNLSDVNYDGSTVLPPIQLSSLESLIPYKFGVIQYRQLNTGATRVLSSTFNSLKDAALNANGSVVLLGVKSGLWEIEEREGLVQASRQDFPFLRRYRGAFIDRVTEANCPGCEPVRILPNGVGVLVVFAGVNGMYLARLELAEARAGSNTTSSSSSSASADYFVLQWIFNEIATVSVIVVDDYSQLGFIALHAEGDPSTIMKFDTKRCVITGTIPLAVVGADREVAVAMATQEGIRRLDVLAPLSLTQRVIELSLFAVSGLQPTMADTKGGTIITLSGEGFVPGMLCDFSGRRTSSDFINKHELHCVAPAGGTEDCDGEIVEAVHSISGMTNNQKRLLRRPSAIVRQIINDETKTNVGFTHGSNITVIGAGFTLCATCTKNLLSCKYLSPNSPNNSVIVEAKLISSNEIQCLLPAISVPLPKPSYVEVSIDGSVFSENEVPYLVLGDAATLFITSPESPFIIQASQQSDLPIIQVAISDSVFHPLGTYTKNKNDHDVSVSLGEFQLGLLSSAELAGETSSASQSSGIGGNGTSAPLSLEIQEKLATQKLTGNMLIRDYEGVSIFLNLSIIRPPVGTQSLIFMHANFSWRTSIRFSVVEGEPHELFFIRKPSNITNNQAPILQVQPIVAVRDVSGNTILDLQSKKLLVSTVVVQFTLHDLQGELQNRTLFTPETNAEFRVEGITITGKHEHEYYINFSTPGLPVLTSDAIVVGPCQTTEYAVKNTTRCEPCPPEGAVCDGTFIVRAQENWWRADNTLQFYYCGDPFSGDSCYNNSQCRPGYESPRCSDCVEGYGRAGRACQKCRSSTEGNLALLVFIGVIVLVLLAILIVSVVTGTSMDLFPVVFRNFLTYMQILARLAELRTAWPPLLVAFFHMLRKAEVQIIDIAPLDCALRLDYYRKYLVLMVLPWALTFLVAAISYIIANLTKTKEENAEKALALVEGCKERQRTEVVEKIELLQLQARIGKFARAARMSVMEGGKKGGRRGHHRHVRQSMVTTSSGGEHEKGGGSTERSLSLSRRDSVDSNASSVASVLNAGRLRRIADFLHEKETPQVIMGTSLSSDPQRIQHLQTLKVTERDKNLVNSAGGADTIFYSRIDYVKDILRLRESRTNFINVAIVATVVVFSMFYATLVQTSGTILMCETIDFGTADPLSPRYRSVAIYQRGTFCNSEEYRFFSLIAISLLVVYGAGIPLGIVLAMAVMKVAGGLLKARLVLAFVMNGLKSDLSFWETTNMVRKFCAMLVVVFVREPKLQLIAFMWTVVTGFLLQVNFSPYTNSKVHQLESMGQAAMVVTLNLMMLFFFFDDSTKSTGAGWFGVSLLIILINTLATFGYFYVMYFFIRERYRRWKEQRGRAEQRKELLESRLEALESNMQIVDKCTTQITECQEQGQLLSGICGPTHEGGEELGGVASPDWKFPIDDELNSSISSTKRKLNSFQAFGFENSSEHNTGAGDETSSALFELESMQPPSRSQSITGFGLQKAKFGVAGNSDNRSVQFNQSLVSNVVSIPQYGKVDKETKMKVGEDNWIPLNEDFLPIQAPSSTVPIPRDIDHMDILERQEKNKRVADSTSKKFPKQAEEEGGEAGGGEEEMERQRSLIQKSSHILRNFIEDEDDEDDEEGGGNEDEKEKKSKMKKDYLFDGGGKGNTTLSSSVGSSRIHRLGDESEFRGSPEEAGMGGLRTASLTAESLRRLQRGYRSTSSAEQRKHRSHPMNVTPSKAKRMMTLKHGDDDDDDELLLFAKVGSSSSSSASSGEVSDYTFQQMRQAHLKEALSSIQEAVPGIDFAPDTQSSQSAGRKQTEKEQGKKFTADLPPLPGLVKAAPVDWMGQQDPNRPMVEPTSTTDDDVIDLLKVSKEQKQRKKKMLLVSKKQSSAKHKGGAVFDEEKADDILGLETTTATSDNEEGADLFNPFEAPSKRKKKRKEEQLLKRKSEQEKEKAKKSGQEKTPQKKKGMSTPPPAQEKLPRKTSKDRGEKQPQGAIVVPPEFKLNIGGVITEAPSKITNAEQDHSEGFKFPRSLLLPDDAGQTSSSDDVTGLKKVKKVFATSASSLGQEQTATGTEKEKEIPIVVEEEGWVPPPAAQHKHKTHGFSKKKTEKGIEGDKNKTKKRRKGEDVDVEDQQEQKKGIGKKDVTMPSGPLGGFSPTILSTTPATTTTTRGINDRNYMTSFLTSSAHTLDIPAHAGTALQFDNDEEDDLYDFDSNSAGMAALLPPTASSAVSIVPTSSSSAMLGLTSLLTGTAVSHYQESVEKVHEDGTPRRVPSGMTSLISASASDGLGIEGPSPKVNVANLSQYLHEEDLHTPNVSDEKIQSYPRNGTSQGQQDEENFVSQQLFLSPSTPQQPVVVQNVTPQENVATVEGKSSAMTSQKDEKERKKMHKTKKKEGESISVAWGISNPEVSAPYSPLYDEKKLLSGQIPSSSTLLGGLPTGNAMYQAALMTQSSVIEDDDDDDEVEIWDRKRKPGEDSKPQASTVRSQQVSSTAMQQWLLQPVSSPSGSAVPFSSSLESGPTMPTFSTPQPQKVGSTQEDLKPQHATSADHPLPKRKTSDHIPSEFMSAPPQQRHIHFMEKSNEDTTAMEGQSFSLSLTEFPETVTATTTSYSHPLSSAITDEMGGGKVESEIFGERRRSLSANSNVVAIPEKLPASKETTLPVGGTEGVKKRRSSTERKSAFKKSSKAPSQSQQVQQPPFVDPSFLEKSLPSGGAKQPPVAKLPTSSLLLQHDDSEYEEN